MKFLALTLTALTSFSAFAQLSLWPTIPFVRGADLCQYQDAYGQARQQAINESARIAENFLYAGASGREAVAMLLKLDELVDKNRQLAIQGYGLDVMLENTLRSYTDDLYRRLKPREKKILFTNAVSLVDQLEAIRNGQRQGTLTSVMLKKLSGFAYGTYSYAPGCKGDLLVTLTVLSKDGRTETFMAQNKPSFVMGDIASRMFEAYQRTSFPTTLRIGARTLTLVGGLNGTVDRVRSTTQAEVACESLDARLPSEAEYEAISAYGDWSGGVSLNEGTWAMENDRVYHAPFRSMPVRNTWEVNETEYLYYCVK